MTVLSSNSGTKCFCIFESVHVGLEVVHNFAALEVSMLFFHRRTRGDKSKFENIENIPRQVHSVVVFRSDALNTVSGYESLLMRPLSVCQS